MIFLVFQFKMIEIEMIHSDRLENKQRQESIVIVAMIALYHHLA